MMKKIRGRAAWIFSNNVDVDTIVGIENISVTDTDKLVAAAMKAYEVDFADKIQVGDIMVAGSNLGYGHPHPQSMIALRELGIDTIIAESFAFPFYRSELAKGMKLLECPGISSQVQRWDVLEVDMDKNTVTNITQGVEHNLAPLPEIPRKIMAAGGLMGFLRQQQ